MLLSRNKENNVYPCKPKFYYIKVGFKGFKIIQVCFRVAGNKILWKRGEIALNPKEQFLLFSTIFSIYLYLQESNYIFIC